MSLHVLGIRQACFPSPNLCFTISFSSSTVLQLLLLLDVLIPLCQTVSIYFQGNGRLGGGNSVSKCSCTYVSYIRMYVIIYLLLLLLLLLGAGFESRESRLVYGKNMVMDL